MSDDDFGEPDPDILALLAEPSVWVEPPVGLEDRVVAAINTAAGAPRSGTNVVSLSARRGRHAPIWIGAAAALFLLGGLALLILKDGGTSPSFAVDLAPTELIRGAGGSATVTKTASGWRIDLDATGLPRLDNGRFYQAWLRSDDGTLIAVGTFNEGTDVTLWAGVTPTRFPTLTITEEEADGNQESSGRKVLVGPITPYDS